MGLEAQYGGRHHAFARIARGYASTLEEARTGDSLGQKWQERIVGEGEGRGERKDTFACKRQRKRRWQGKGAKA
jgi:hypothetical protein